MSPLTVDVDRHCVRRRSGGVNSRFWACGRLDSVADPADDVGEGRKVAQLEAVVAGDAVVLADRGEHLGLLDGVHTEVGLQVEIHVEQIGRIAGQLGDDAHHGVGHVITGTGRRSHCRRRFERGASAVGGASAAAAGAGAPVLSRIQPMTWVRVGKVAQLEAVVAGDAVVLADGGEHLGLLDGVHTEVGLQVKIDVEQIGRIAGQLGDDAHHGVGHVITGTGRRSHCRRRFGAVLPRWEVLRRPPPGREPRSCRGSSRRRG